MDMTPRRFVVLDRDGTIIEEKHYLSDPDQVELIPGAGEGLRLLREMDLGLVVVTNQSGVGRGYFDQKRLDLIHDRLCERLGEFGVFLDGVYVCPHRPEDRCSCRKPRPYLLQAAAREKGFDPENCFIVGDQACDIELGQRVGGTTFLVKTGYGIAAAVEGNVKPDYVVDDLSAAAKGIRRLLLSEDVRDIILNEIQYETG
jgi:D-glycero-D-manno-heptose 1,7-bisphosphate phosphatase